MGGDALADVREGLRAGRAQGGSGGLARLQEHLRGGRRCDGAALRPKTSNGPYGFYYWNLLTKRRSRGQADIFKHDLAMPDEAVTVEYLLDRLVICGGVNSVVDQILAFRETVGDFGTLLYCGPRLGRSEARAPLDGVDGGEGDACSQRGDRPRPARGVRLKAWNCSKWGQSDFSRI